MELKGTFPLCQKLLYGKVELDDNEKTIAELAIPPGAVLNVLTFDQDVDDLDLDKFHSKFCLESASLFCLWTCFSCGNQSLTIRGLLTFF